MWHMSHTKAINETSKIYGLLSSNITYHPSYKKNATKFDFIIEESCNKTGKILVNLQKNGDSKVFCLWLPSIPVCDEHQELVYIQIAVMACVSRIIYSGN